MDDGIDALFNWIEKNATDSDEDLRGYFEFFKKAPERVKGEMRKFYRTVFRNFAGEGIGDAGRDYA